MLSDNQRMEVIEHLLFGLLKISHAIYSRMQMGPLGLPLERLSNDSVPIYDEETKVIFDKDITNE